MKDLQERFKSLDSVRLLKIIEESHKYDPMAVEAAKLELSARSVNDEEVKSFKLAYHAAKDKEKNRKNSLDEFEQKTKKTGSAILAIINPLREGPISTKGKVNLFTLGFIILAILKIKSSFHLFKFIFRGNQDDFDLSTFLYLYT